MITMIMLKEPSLKRVQKFIKLKDKQEFHEQARVFIEKEEQPVPEEKTPSSKVCDKVPRKIVLSGMTHPVRYYGNKGEFWSFNGEYELFIPISHESSFNSSIPNKLSREYHRKIPGFGPHVGKTEKEGSPVWKSGLAYIFRNYDGYWHLCASSDSDFAFRSISSEQDLPPQQPEEWVINTAINPQISGLLSPGYGRGPNPTIQLLFD